METLPCFSSGFTKGNNFCDFHFASLDVVAFLGFYVKGKNLLLWEQIISPKNWPPLKKEIRDKIEISQLHPLKMNLFTLNKTAVPDQSASLGVV